MAELGLAQFARFALDVAQATVSRYRTTFSEHRFTQRRQALLPGLTYNLYRL